jgi:hypothetical protein
VVERDEAVALVRRFSCEPGSIELIEAAEQAVA